MVNAPTYSASHPSIRAAVVLPSNSSPKRGEEEAKTSCVFFQNCHSDSKRGVCVRGIVVVKKKDWFNTTPGDRREMSKFRGKKAWLNKFMASQAVTQVYKGDRQYRLQGLPGSFLGKLLDEI